MKIIITLFKGSVKRKCKKEGHCRGGKGSILFVNNHVLGMEGNTIKSNSVPKNGFSITRSKQKLRLNLIPV